MFTIGVIEGITESTAAITKVFSGGLSDYWRKRKSLLVAGYGLAAFSKPIFPLANSIGWVFTARLVDRIGKGIRGAPRDALIADVTSEGLRGRAYGLRQSLDTVGAFAGPLLALLLMTLFTSDVRAVLWVAAIPALASVIVLAAFVNEPAVHSSVDPGRPRLSLNDVRLLGAAFWMVVFLGGVLTLARFSEAFLLLRAQDSGLPASQVPITLVIMNLVYALSSYPAGWAADRIDRRALLIVGTAVLIIADLFLATAAGVGFVLAGAAIWGLHMGFTQGLLAALVADNAPRHLRGTAFGVFNLVTGALMLAASGLAGFLWSRYGAYATFMAGAAFSATTVIGLIAFRKKGTRGQPIRS
jgi:MFS family permease